MKNYKLLFLILFFAYCTKKAEISTTSNRFIDEVLAELVDISKLKTAVVLVPSDCSSCISKDKELLRILSQRKSKDNIVISTQNFLKQIEIDSAKLEYFAVPNMTLQRYGFIGNLGVVLMSIRKYCKFPLIVLQLYYSFHFQYLRTFVQICSIYLQHLAC